MKKQIIEIAEYDGWKKGAFCYYTGRGVNAIFASYEGIVKKYAGDLNELHRVAMDLVDELYALGDDGGWIMDIYDSFKHRPQRRRYTRLMTSISYGITYLKSQRNK